jgi:hypothetical protein
MLLSFEYRCDCVVRPARVLSPKPHFLILIFCLIARVLPHAYHFPIFLSFLFQVLCFLLKYPPAVAPLEYHRRSGAPCRYLFSPNFACSSRKSGQRGTRRTLAITNSTAAGIPPNLLPYQSPSLPHVLHARTYERVHLAAPVRQSC